MSLIDEFIFTLTISLIVTTIIIRLLSMAADAADTKKTASTEASGEPVIKQSSSSACRTTGPSEEVSAAGESHSSAGSVIKQPASPAVTSRKTHVVAARTLTKQADFGGESSEIVINKAKQASAAAESHAVPANAVTERAVELASPVEKYDPVVVYRVDSPDSARDCAGEGTVIGDEAELGKSAARESGTLDNFGPAEVGSSRDAAVGSLSSAEEDKTAVVTEAAATCQLIYMPMLSLSPKGVDHKNVDKVFDESSKRDSINIAETGSKSDDLVEGRTESEEDVGGIEELRVLEGGDAGVLNKDAGEQDEFIDDWEGIERTELEKNFGAAVAFVGSRSNAGCISGLANDTKMKLYGLHKVAIRGPCLVPQPMALKVTARGNWNAWQVLGDMTRETAMEQYIALLSSGVPAWTADGVKDDQEVLDRGLSPSPPTDSLEVLVIENQSLPEELKPPSKVHGV